ncbi:hypothetical protein [Phytohabitans aurantiacus]|uniref:Uncharacterized protein n=1 Tax=Phytohabitans aurantiacus TaxID=3016789 RepID=A0ABQ5QRX0_9ACTN|nr:hypothetical protein [Phytohabitans aurantiacus]GLH97376.1 hypothetical protein Pa4123_26510 [Phytohabitans aurantiacus]
MTKGRGCEGKQAQPTRKAALAQITSLVRRRGALRSRYQVYQCRHCGAWHIGHGPRGKR